MCGASNVEVGREDEVEEEDPVSEAEEDEDASEGELDDDEDSGPPKVEVAKGAVMLDDKAEKDEEEVVAAVEDRVAVVTMRSRHRLTEVGTLYLTCEFNSTLGSEADVTILVE